MMLPNFLIIGGQRCGSTWLYKGLRAHPEVFLPDKKELEFFSYESTNSAPGLEEYEKYFRRSGNAVAIGEASPSYFWVSAEHQTWLSRPPGFESDIPGRVKSTLGADTRLVVIVRNPVHRAISAFLHHVRMGRLDPARGLLNASRHAGIVHMGFYGAHLERWLDDFTFENFKVLIFEQAVTNPSDTFLALQQHLGIALMPSVEGGGQAVNAGPPAQFSTDGVYARFGHDPEPIKILTAEELDELSAIFEEDMTRFASLVGRSDLVRIWDTRTPTA